MTNEPSTVELSVQDLRVVTRYAAESAQEVLAIFEEDYLTTDGLESPSKRRGRSLGSGLHATDTYGTIGYRR